MTRVRALVLGLGLLAVSVAAAEDKKADKAAGKFDAAKVVGVWKLADGMKGGDKIGDDAKKGTCTITKDAITLKGDDGMTFKFSYTTDAKTDPAGIDLEIVEPDGLKGTKAKGIVAADGKMVKLAYHPMGGDRPKTFESTKDNGVYMFTLKSADAKGDKADEKKADTKTEKKTEKKADTKDDKSDK